MIRKGLIHKLSLLFLIALLASCNSTQLPPTAHSPSEADMGDEHDHGDVISLTNPRAVRTFFQGGVAKLNAHEPFEQLGFMITSEAPLKLEYRTSQGAWQAAEVTWQEAPLYNARIILEHPTQTLELRGGDFDTLRLEFHEKATQNSGLLARDLPFEKAPTLDSQVAPSSLVVSRSQWGARDPSKVCGKAHTPYRMAIHHTDGNNGEDQPGRGHATDSSLSY